MRFHEPPIDRGGQEIDVSSHPEKRRTGKYGRIFFTEGFSKSRLRGDDWTGNISYAFISHQRDVQITDPPCIPAIVTSFYGHFS
jgi:hypothetical protein